MKVYNFSAGPAMLPEEVMLKAQEEFCNYGDTQCGILELSHRGPQFMDVLATAKQNIRDLMNINDDYEICFVQGGASMQFCMIPMNFLSVDGVADYADSGTWSTKSIKEAQRFGKVNVIGSSKETNYDRIPVVRHWKPSEGAAYLHITSNNTIAGTQYHTFPPVKAGVPMIADMSSDFMSRVIDINDFGMVYGGAQKNLGPSGVALVIIRKDLAARGAKDIPTMLRYDTYIDKDSMFNTPPTFAIYLLKLVTDWMKAKGGLAMIEEINNTKSEALYELMDGSDFYRSPVSPGSRSKMNVVFRLPTEELEAKFIKGAGANGMSGLKGHRSVGGVRASIYNAMPIAGVEKLIDFMIQFEKNNG
jgi:phosphoserine aminotransferase